MNELFVKQICLHVYIICDLSLRFVDDAYGHVFFLYARSIHNRDIERTHMEFL